MAFDIDDLRRKANAGSAVAQTALGICFLDGIDVEVNYAEAFQLLSAAAKQGASRSIVSLARMYEKGLGVEEDMEEAVRLYRAVADVEFSAAISLGRAYAGGTGVERDSREALRYYKRATEWGDRVTSADMKEARDYVSEHTK